MFGPPREGPFDALMRPPARAGAETTTIHAVVDDVPARHDRFRAAGAEIVMPLEAQSYGGSGFSVRDAEGHIWSFADYAPRVVVAIDLGAMRDSVRGI